MLVKELIANLFVTSHAWVCSHSDVTVVSRRSLWLEVDTRHPPVIESLVKQQYASIWQYVTTQCDFTNRYDSPLQALNYVHIVLYNEVMILNDVTIIS